MSVPELTLPDTRPLARVPSPDPLLVLPVTGPPGPPGAAGEGHIHLQAAPAANWIITHNLGIKPGVSVQVDGQQVIAEVTYTSDDVVTITFASPRSGSARLS